MLRRHRTLNLCAFVNRILREKQTTKLAHCRCISLASSMTWESHATIERIYAFRKFSASSSAVPIAETPPSFPTEENIVVASFAAEAEEYPHWVQTPVDFEIKDSKSAEELLEIAAKYPLSAAQQASVVARLGQHFSTSTNPEELLQMIHANSRFKFIVESLEYQHKTLTSGDVLLALRSLLFLRIPVENRTIISLQTSIKNRLETGKMSKKFRANPQLNQNPKLNSSLPMYLLVPFAVYHADFAKNSVEGAELQNVLAIHIIDRLAEVTDPKLLLTILQKLEDPRYLENFFLVLGAENLKKFLL